MPNYVKFRNADGSFVDLGYAKVGGQASNATVYCDETYDQRVMVQVTGPTARCMTIASDTYFGLYDANAQSWIWKQSMPIYPVGSLYMSINNTSPASLFGGTWSPIYDRFVIAAGSSYNSNTSGGEATHTLTIEEMPSHSHYTQGNLMMWRGSGGNTKTEYGSAMDTDSHFGKNFSLSAGGNAAHNNIPPYYAAYIWVRIS